jgi:hypothetical protein
MCVCAFALYAVAPARAQQPPATPGWPSPLPLTVGEPAAAAVPSGLPERVVIADPEPPKTQALGQQHWVSLNLSVLQPLVARLGVKVFPRPNNSIWLETYIGSELFDFMYGFGVRVQHTSYTNDRCDALMVSPGLGLHVLPNWYASGHARHSGYGEEYDPYRPNFYNSLYYLALDVDVSWLHDFGPHFGYEIGMKVGLAGRVGGTVGSHFTRSVMFGKDVFPILNFYSGLRF